MSPRRAPGAPGAAQEPPRRHQEPPGARQEAPKTTQERPRSGPKGPQAAETFVSPFWPHLGAPGASLSSFLGVLLEPRARSARQTKALVEITGQKVFRNRCGPDVQRPLSTKLLN